VNREPVLSAGTTSAAIAAVIALLVSFGFDISDDQQSAILGVVAVLAPIVAAIAARPKVTPLSSPRDAAGAPLTAIGGGAPDTGDDFPAGKPYIA
jgi:hypothetical protein